MRDPRLTQGPLWDCCKIWAPDGTPAPSVAALGRYWCRVGAAVLAWHCAVLALTPSLPLQASGAVPSAAAWAIASPTAPSWRRCRPSKSATSAARTTWPTALWTSSPESVLPHTPPGWAWVPFQPKGLSCTAVAPFPDFWSPELLPAQPDKAPAPEGNVWSCAATACYISGVLGKQVAVPQGKRKPQVGRLVWPAACCPCQPPAVVRSGSCVAPHKSTQFLWVHLLHLDLYILSGWLFPSPQTCWDAARAR